MSKNRIFIVEAAVTRSSRSRTEPALMPLRVTTITYVLRGSHEFGDIPEVNPAVNKSGEKLLQIPRVLLA